MLIYLNFFVKSRFLIVLLLLTGCDFRSAHNTLFDRLKHNQTGIDFSNQLIESDTFNVIDFDYIYNGAGVGVADLNGDGLPDIFFGGNQVSSRLYLNLGNFNFKDVTVESMVGTESWVEGVTFVDINSDGLLDIYLSVSNHSGSENPNLLFVNKGTDQNGVPLFEEQAKRYGLDLVGYFTQAAFFDFDRDGNLDCYLLSNALESFQRNTSRPRITDGSGASNDFLLRNNGLGRFIDVTHESGVLFEGYGLGLVITDVNGDHWPDIYVANDFLSNDVLYINQQDGTFRNEIPQRIDHQSFNAMGVDAGDINGDGWVDLVVLDMYPPDNYRQKTMFSPTENYNQYRANLDRGYEPQYVRNTLQLNRGDGTFAEIGEMAGVSQTDWSWSPLLADFDLDGNPDLLVSNGYGKDITDLDFINFSNNMGPFMTPEDRKQILLEGLGKLKEVKLKNYAFRNTGDLTFEDVSEAWGIDDPAITNGMAYADLDGDGDLDLVTNELNSKAGVFRNNLLEGQRTGQNNWLKIKLKGDSKNLFAIGAKIQLFLTENDRGKILTHEHQPSRGYKSAMLDDTLFGLGKSGEVDSIRVIWPDGKLTKLPGTTPNQLVEIAYSAGLEEAPPAELHAHLKYEEVSEQLGIHYEPQLIPHEDFNRQILLPMKHSTLGPGVAVGDINGDNLEDFYLAGSAGSPGQLFIQKPNGQFAQSALEGSGTSDEMGALLFDADGDGDLDLYVVAGGSRFEIGHTSYQDRLYINDGMGRFSLASDRIPEMTGSGSVVRAVDFDRDGDLDLFVGGRIQPGRYPESPRSYLLENKEGIFIDVTADKAPELLQAGMVSDALWTDVDQDGNVDLLVVGEWMPITVFQNKKDASGVRFESVVIQGRDWNSSGWWNSITPLAFIDGKGPTYALGNLGENSRWKASQEKALELHFGDFDKNGSVDPVLFHYAGDTMFPLASRNQLVGQVPRWRNRFLAYGEFARISRDRFFDEEEKELAEILQAKEFRSGILYAGDSVSFSPLPKEAQFSRIFGMVELPDGLLYAGNFYGNETVTGRNDAGRGGLITFTEHGNTMQHSPVLPVPGEGRAMAWLIGAGGDPILLVSRYNGPLLAFRIGLGDRRTISVSADDQEILIYRRSGPPLKRELYYGTGYLSQSSRKVILDRDVDSIQVVNSRGVLRTVVF